MQEILIAFVSPVSENFLTAPIFYPDIKGKSYAAIQTNETAIIYLERMLEKNSLAQIFLIASDKVKNDFIEIETEFGKVTHLEFLKRRIVKECPQLENKFVELDYSDSEGLEKNILQIAEITDAITTYAKNFPAEKIKVHADMTGGFRHTSMFMLSIIQLLKYRGMEIGEVLYSDPAKKIVYRANEIQEISLLITGADEFVKFGSVEALQEYFEKNPAAATNNLLDAMKRFSEAIKICRTGTIEGELKKLGREIQLFRQSQNKDIKSELFAKIIDTVEEGYGNLISGNASRLDIIRWCMQKNFWQQAITLCTEWLPEEIISRGVFMPENDLIVKDAEIDGEKNFGRNWQQHLIINYQRTSSAKISAGLLSAFVKKLKDILNNLPNFTMTAFIAEAYGDLKKIAAEYDDAENFFRLCQRGKKSFADFEKKYFYVNNALKNIYNDRKKNPDYKKNFIGFLRTFYYADLFSQLRQLPDATLLKALKIDKNVAIDYVLDNNTKNLDSAPSKWQHRKNCYAEMLDNGVAKSNLNDRAKVFDLLEGYYNIRQERNKINHANSTSQIEISALQKTITTYLDKLEKI